MVTAANICKEMVGACMAVHLAGQPVIVTARDEPAGTVTIAARLIAGQGIMRMASCLTRIMIAVGNIMVRTNFQAPAGTAVLTAKRIVASLQRVLTVRGSQEARMALTACALCHAAGTKTEAAV